MEGSVGDRDRGWIGAAQDTRPNGLSGLIVVFLGFTKGEDILEALFERLAWIRHLMRMSRSLGSHVHTTRLVIRRCGDDNGCEERNSQHSMRYDKI